MEIRKPEHRSAKILAIEYRGPAKQDAESLANGFRAGGVTLNPPREAADGKATLAVGEIILTIVASAAARALLDVTLDKLRMYMVNRIQGNTLTSESPNLQISVAKENGQVVARKLVSLRVASVEFVTKFVKEVGEAVVKAVGEAS